LPSSARRRVRLRPAHLPYDAGRLLWFLGLHAVPGLETWDGTTYARALRLPNGPGAVRLTPAGTGYVGELRLTSAGDERAARQRLAHLLDLGSDPAAALTHLAADPVLGPLVAQRPGVRAPGSVDHVETLVRTVVGQQVSLAGARAVAGRVVRTYGEELPEALRELGPELTFPSARALAAADPESLPMPRARGRAVVGVARAVVEQGEEVADGRPEHAAALLALPGIGPWTAAYLALRAAREPDAFLPTDLAVRRALEGHGMAADPASALAGSLAWSPYRSLALMHLWTHLLEGRREAGPLSVGRGRL
jgi:AraC family transcriptional regulator of adaptative response / DNA-3-methyladenine glycosylase II